MISGVYCSLVHAQCSLPSIVVEYWLSPAIPTYFQSVFVTLNDRNDSGSLPKLPMSPQCVFSIDLSAICMYFCFGGRLLFPCACHIWYDLCLWHYKVDMKWQHPTCQYRHSRCSNPLLQKIRNTRSVYSSFGFIYNLFQFVNCDPFWLNIDCLLRFLHIFNLFLWHWMIGIMEPDYPYYSHMTQCHMFRGRNLILSVYSPLIYLQFVLPSFLVEYCLFHVIPTHFRSVFVTLRSGQVNGLETAGRLAPRQMVQPSAPQLSESVVVPNGQNNPRRPPPPVSQSRPRPLPPNNPNMNRRRPRRPAPIRLQTSLSRNVEQHATADTMTLQARKRYENMMDWYYDEEEYGDEGV